MPEHRDLDIVAPNKALKELGELDAQQSKVTELRWQLTGAEDGRVVEKRQSL